MQSSFCTTCDLDLGQFAKLCGQEANLGDYPHAKAIAQNAVLYAAADLLAADEIAIKTELNRCLKDGPGLLVVQETFPDAVLDRSTELFNEIIAAEKAVGDHRGDHFAKPGANERIWNSMQKVCEKDPAAFIDYYSNAILALLAESWLGPYYQITAQVNIVKPGGQSQSAHRDYHLGFQENALVAQFPVHLQVASQFMTLQGAIAHTNMPVETGPTLYLPFSQQYPLGYLAWRDSAFKTYFDEHAVQLPLQKGDAVFLSPALFHAAGANTTADQDRVANLVQISAAFGKTMETVNHDTMLRCTYPLLLERATRQTIDDGDLQRIATALADGYSFPTNLDLDPPIDGSAPATCRDLLLQALAQRWPVEEFNAALAAHAERRQA
jgi:ectoine hydroxylase-related dioxygenase (phytanoyl-CoA dioxygenase family)